MSNTEPFDTDGDLEEPDPAAEEASWDAFWDETLRQEAAEHGTAPTETIRGVTVRVPQDLPLRYEQKAERLKNSDSDTAFAELVAELFGADVLETWREAGMGVREFRVVLAWGLSHGKAKPISFREAYDLVMSKDNKDEDDNEDEGDEGKDESSTQASGKSAGSGRSSKRTSAANTGSARQT